MSILVGEATRVVVAGITGWQARAHTGFMRKYGTRVVAGVVPGRAGEDCDGVPVYDSFATALDEHPADAAVLFVPAAAAAESAIEAAGAGIGMILVCAEGRSPTRRGANDRPCQTRGGAARGSQQSGRHQPRTGEDGGHGR